MEISWTLLLIYVGIFLQAFIFSLLLTPIALVAGRRFGLMDEPGERKIHSTTIPRSGGLAIFFAFVGTLILDVIIFWLFIEPDSKGAGLMPFRANVADVLPRLAAILTGLTFLFIVGVIDDKKPLSPIIKLGCQILAAVPLLFSGVQISVFLFKTGYVFWIKNRFILYIVKRRSRNSQ